MSPADNQASWDYANSRQNRRKGDFAASIRDGRNLPSPILDALAFSVGDRVLHMLCNDGREAATLAFHTGAHIHGVDFSEEAVRFARGLNTELSLANEFTTAEAYSFLEEAGPAPASRYDRILLTPGSIRWLPDLRRFFDLCANRLEPGGLLTVWDFHPLRLCFDDDRRLTRGYPTSPHSYVREGIRDYAATNKDYVMFARHDDTSGPYDNPHTVHTTEYGLASVAEAVLDHPDMRLTRLAELGFSWEQRCLPWLEPDTDGVFTAPPGTPEVPVTFLLQAQRRHPPSA